MAETESLPFERVDGVLASWRQGDCFLGEEWFLYRINPSLPLTSAGRDAAGEGMDAAEESVAGWMVVSQTCDIVRNSSERPRRSGEVGSPATPSCQGSRSKDWWLTSNAS